MRTSSFGGGSRGSWKRYIDPQSQGLYRKLNPPSVTASNELLWEAGGWNGEFLHSMTFPFASRKFYVREKRGNTVAEWVISPQNLHYFYQIKVRLKIPSYRWFQVGIRGSSCAIHPTPGTSCTQRGLNRMDDGCSWSSEPVVTVILEGNSISCPAPAQHKLSACMIRVSVDPSWLILSPACCAWLTCFRPK